MTRKEEYQAYLRSDHWRDLRTRCLAAAGGKCKLCGRPRFLQAHHRFYRPNFYDTQLGDLLALCVYCHSRHHGKTPNIPAAWIEQERRKFRVAQKREVKNQKPKWVRRMLSKAATNRNKRMAVRRRENDYALAAFRERLRVIVEG